jgi:hypothetical protein
MMHLLLDIWLLRRLVAALNLVSGFLKWTTGFVRIVLHAYLPTQGTSQGGASSADYSHPEG